MNGGVEWKVKDLRLKINFQLKSIMRQLLSVIFLVFAMALCLLANAFSEEVKIGTPQHPLVVSPTTPVMITTEKPISLDNVNALALSTKKDYVDYVIGLGTFLSACAAAFAAWSTRKAANAALRSAEEQQKQNYLVRMNALEIMSKYYEKRLTSINELGEVIAGMKKSESPEKDLEVLNKVISGSAMISDKIIAIEKEICGYYDDLMKKTAG